MINMAVSTIVTEASELVANGKISEAADCVGRYLRMAVPRPFELEVCGRLLAEWSAAGFWVDDPVKVAVIGSYTTENIVSALRCAWCMEGHLINVYEAPFGAYQQEILDPNSGLYMHQSDIVLIALGYRDLPTIHDANISQSDLDRLLDAYVARWEALWRQLYETSQCSVWQHTFEAVSNSYLGPADRFQSARSERIARLLNERLRDEAPSFVHWIDTAFLAQRVGVENWADSRLYYSGKFGFNPRFLDRYTATLSGLVRARLGATKKALVTDLDNTLWGGVIGDDGLQGIELGPETPSGEAYADFCEYLRDLGQRGVILAVCSKNDPEIARRVFDSHPAMPLKFKDFSAFQCSWEDKAAGLREISRQLNIGLNHIVFVDDNPVECELIRKELPEVTVIELADDPTKFIDLVERGHWFDSNAFSKEDQLRRQSYQANSRIDHDREAATDLPSFLRGLEMTSHFRRAVSADVLRIAQMEMKTNQFNLTTRRYDETRLRAMLNDPQRVIYVANLRDRFADHGLVTALNLIRDGETWRIDSWLMSCRVFSRSLEYFVFQELLKDGKRAGIKRIIGEYLPTERNKVTKSLFSDLGFVAIPGTKGLWEFTISSDRGNASKVFIDAEISDGPS